MAPYADSPSRPRAFAATLKGAQVGAVRQSLRPPQTEEGGLPASPGQLQLEQVPCPRQFSRYSVQAVSGSGA
jgi:hypothetical protein